MSESQVEENVPLRPNILKSSNPQFDYLFKLVLLGDTNSGKTSLLLRFVDNTFSTIFLPTIGIDFKTKIIPVREKQVKIQVWDTAGREKFASVSDMFFCGVMGAIYCFDVTSKTSFEHVERWMKRLAKSTYNCSDDNVNIPSVIVGCKCDSESRKISKEKGLELAVRYSMRYVETSAQSGMGVEEVFSGLASSVLSRQLGWNQESKQTPTPSSLSRKSFILRPKSFMRKSSTKSLPFRRSAKSKSLPKELSKCRATSEPNLALANDTRTHNKCHPKGIKACCVIS